LLSAEADPALRRQLRTLARQRGFPVQFVGTRSSDSVRIQGWRRLPFGLAVDLQAGAKEPIHVRVPLAGAFQAPNVALAVAACLELEQRGFPGLRRALAQGCRQVAWPGRMETISRRPAIILDGAHNPAAAQALAREFQEQGQSCFLVIGRMRDKDATGIAQALAPISRQVWTVIPPDERGLAAADLASIFQKQGTPACACSTLRLALKKALSAAGTRGTVLVTGSLYLSEPARQVVFSLLPPGFAKTI